MPYVIEVPPLATPQPPHVQTSRAPTMILSRGRLLGLVFAMVLCGGVAQAGSDLLPAAPATGNDENGSPGFLTSAPARVPASGSAGEAWQESNRPATRWTFWVGTIVLQRSSPNSQTLVVNAQQETLFNANQIGFFIQAGP